MALTWIEIDKQNLLYNIRQFRNLAPNSEFWPVIKSNAYGHGLKEMASFLADNDDVSGFMVASLDEALEVKNFTKKPIIVLSYFDIEDKAALSKVDKQISLPVYDVNTINRLDALKQDIFVNIKIDTGTSRLGFGKDNIKNIIQDIENTKHLKIFSIFTHYAESEAEDQAFSKEQLSIFQEITKDYKHYKLHSACSAASISLPESRTDIIRIGLAFYGLWPSKATQKRAWMSEFNLLPLMTWKTKVIQIKKLQKGDTIGYNRTYKCNKDCQIAVLPIGYNDGYDRLLSNKSQVLIGGQRCPVRGNVCMNLTMVELPDSLNIKVGETVTLLGKDKKEAISSEELADICQTINYEIVSRINPNIKRLII